MFVDPSRWEHGSDFSYPETVVGNEAAVTHPFTGASFWHSGRDALRALILKERPDRVLFPSFYCQDVYAAARGIADIGVYFDDPLQPRVDVDASSFRKGDLVVLSNTFGLRRESPLRPEDYRGDGAIIAEDHTHDPLSSWARTSKAHFAFASLRKWFPIPDGAVLWSPTGLALEGEPPFDLNRHAAAAACTLDRLSAMLLKARYLAGESIEKSTFRTLSVRGEEHFATSPEPTPISPLARALFGALPRARWRTARHENHQAFVEAFGPVEDDRCRVLSASFDEVVTPYCILIALASAELREKARSFLVHQRIYPAVLWPLSSNGQITIPPEHIDLSQRILCLHCDQRYDATDMQRVARALRNAIL